ncbi:MAG TPA: toprim domain-containing protein [Candidatus Paceibacterota bacterium]|nr:toprim domain-containing protein [Candidatus Paceibacterota bacterium]
MTPFDKLARYFEKFPGIGSRQARRFVFHLLTMGESDLREFAELIRTIKDEVTECPSCHRFHSGRASERCALCESAVRDRSKLLVVERDTDIDAIERSGVYDGLYFVLGGTVPLLGTEEVKGLRGGALKHTVGERAKEGLSEVILGFSVNPDGENTGRYVESLLHELLAANPIKLSHLGRGLSTGSELEYADPETIKNSLKHRE